MTEGESEVVVMPGEEISREVAAGLVVGPGLRREQGDRIMVTRPGLFRVKNINEKEVCWVDCHSKRYVATRGENVIGVVLAKIGDIFRVDIGTAEPASLSYLAFEGATKRNRPAVSVGDIVYSKLLVASSYTESELVCVDSYGKKAGLGVLTGGGFMFSVSLNLVRKLLSPDCCLLNKLGETAPFEVAVGMNGRVWLRARSVKETMVLAQAVQAAELMTNSEIVVMCHKLTDVLSAY